jgi:hypothetical protein
VSGDRWCPPSEVGVSGLLRGQRCFCRSSLPSRRVICHHPWIRIARVICGSDLGHGATGLRRRDETCGTESTMVLAGRQPRRAGLSRSLLCRQEIASSRPMCVPGRDGGYVGTTPVALTVNELHAMPGPFGPQVSPRTPFGASLSSLFVLRSDSDSAESLCDSSIFMALRSCALWSSTEPIVCDATQWGVRALDPAGRGASNPAVITRVNRQ